MNVNKLFIIGNGFDLHHKIPSSYRDFRDFLANKDGKLIGLAEIYFDSSILWSDFESALAGFDSDSLMENASEWLESYSSDNWKESHNHAYQEAIEDVVTALTKGLKAKFTEWVLQLEIPTEYSDSNDYLNYIEPKSLFLTFNYTSTLQDLYSVPEKNIHYIHNKAENECSNLIFGHTWSPEIKPTKNKINIYEGYDIDVDYYDEDFRIIEGNKLIENYFRETYKPTSKIIKENQSFFDKLRSINQIYVLGHSMSDIDFEYFKKIVESTNIQSTHWRISYYNDFQLACLQATMNCLGVSENLITFSRLPELGSE